VATVPVLYCGPFSPDVVRQHTGGTTALGAKQIREGVVIRLVKSGSARNWTDD
jgi:hypothetical protein